MKKENARVVYKSVLDKLIKLVYIVFGLVYSLLLSKEGTPS